MTDVNHLLAHVPVPDVSKQAVIDRLRERHRRYHNLDHVLEMWQVHNLHSHGRFDDRLVASFCLYHDAIYVPSAPLEMNEEHSADLWNRHARDHLARDERLLVDDMILATADHFRARREAEASHSPDFDLLAWCLDLDLARLGSPRAVFREHTRNLRLEYSHLGDEEWSKGKSQFYANTMAQSNIFTNPEFPEDQARRNLSQTLVVEWVNLGYLPSSTE